jgi:hypothetical protein
MSNYSPELSKILVDKFLAKVPIKQIAVEVDRSEKSVTSKLVALGLYRKKPYTNKLGQVPVKKRDYVFRIAEIIDTEPENLLSLEKVNKSVLKLLETSLS